MTRSNIPDIPHMGPDFGTAEYSAQVTQGRRPGVVTAMAWLAYSHLPPELQRFAQPIYRGAVDLLDRIPNDSAELTTALNTLVEVKDWIMRAGIRSDQGKPGPVPRPATVVDPPSRFETAREITDERLDAPHLTERRGGFPQFPAQEAMQTGLETGPIKAGAEGADWAQTARDLISGDKARIAEHLPTFGRPIQDRPQA